VLPQASCKTCAKETARVEQKCAREMLGRFRIQAKLPTRRKKERPTEMLLHLIDETGRTTTVLAPISDHPPSLVLPKYAQPTIFQGIRGVDTYIPRFWSAYSEEEFAKLRSKFKVTGYNLGGVHPLLFARMLGKIAHATAVFGMDCFTPLLLDLILGRTAVLTDLVGGLLENHPPEPHTHMLDIALRPSLNLIFVKIRLFAQMGAPIYHVVAGSVTPEVATAITAWESMNSRSA
jgi:hypothetical protein